MTVVGAVVLAVAWQVEPGSVSAQAGNALTVPIEPMPEQRRGHGPARQQIGWDFAQDRLGRDMPVGRDIPVGLVEAGDSYAPRETRGLNFILQSGESGVSGHASQCANIGFGQNSPAPGVSRVHCFSTQHWIGAGFLRTGTLEDPDDWNEARVYSHSWVAPKSPHAPIILRRVDYAIDTQDTVVVVGLNNGEGPVPHLLASAYNIISVGRSDGQHSHGGTMVEGDGRIKPELVAPGNLTSHSTPIVAGCAAVLLEAADTMAGDDEASPAAAGRHSEVIKALLMGGAYKSEAWRPDVGRPLDPTVGAGMVDLDRSLVMQAGGPVAPGATDHRYGWSFGQVGHGQPDVFTFEIDVDQGEACFTLVWNRRVIGGAVTLTHPETGQDVRLWNNTPGIADLNLRLSRHEGPGEVRIVAASTGTIDNVEVVFLRELPAGSYTLQIARGPDNFRDHWDYALAWRIEGP